MQARSNHSVYFTPDRSFDDQDEILSLTLRRPIEAAQKLIAIPSGKERSMDSDPGNPWYAATNDMFNLDYGAGSWD
jgi:hypothetical protein